MSRRVVWLSFVAVPAIVVSSGLFALGCGPGEPADDPSMPANSPLPAHLDRPADPSGSPKSADAG